MMWLVALLYAFITHKIFAEGVSTRLVPGPHQGRVEVYHKGSWGTVCDDSFQQAIARVVCRSVGQPSSNAEVVASSMFGQGSGEVHLDNVECNGFEMNLTYCHHRGWGIENCGHSEDVGVVCQEVPGPLAGRVEVYRDGEWGTVCDDSFGPLDAKVVCRSLGLQTEHALNTTFASGNGKIWMDDLNCTGQETSLFSCGHGGWGTHNCAHREDVGVICHHGRAVRLVPGPASGRVEVNYLGKWGTVCDDGFNDVDATVVCRSLGYFPENATAISGYGGGKNDILLDDVMCTGIEATLGDCGNITWGANNCAHSEDVGVSCISELPVRLVPGPTEGRVEVNVNGVWGTVCGDNFRYAEARVVCRSLGLQTDFAEISPMGYGSGSIWLDNLNCTGDESSLGFCKHCGFGVNNCEEDKDVGVVCHTLAPTRLEPGPRAGRVEVYRRGVWGTVCDNQFSYTDAKVLCRSLGYNSEYAEVAPRGTFAYGLGTILLDKLRCSGNETSLSRCSHNGWGVTSCFHSNDVSVICHPHAPTRLVPGPRAGHVEVYRRGVWGAVCMNYFTHSEARVVCRSLDLNSDFIDYYSSSEGLNTTWLSNISCSGNESSLSFCHYQARGSFNCGSGGSVWIMCHKVSIDIPPLQVYPNIEVSVNCTVTTTSEPPLSMIWTLGNVIVGNTSSLSKAFSIEENGEMLKCQVFKNGKQIGSNHTVVDVYYPPEAFALTTKSVIEGYSANISMSVVSNPLPYIYELKRQTDNGSFNTSTLPPVINAVHRSDAGNYILKARNRLSLTEEGFKDGIGVHLLELRVLYPVKTRCPTVQYALRNTTVNITCDVDGLPAPDNITWSHLSTTHPGPHLLIENVQASDSGLYTCTARNTMVDDRGFRRHSTSICKTTLTVLYQTNETHNCGGHRSREEPSTVRP